MDPRYLSEVECAAKAGPAGKQFAAMEAQGIPFRAYHAQRTGRGVPVENLLAIYQAVREFGKYSL